MEGICGNANGDDSDDLKLLMGEHLQIKQGKTLTALSTHGSTNFLSKAYHKFFWNNFLLLKRSKFDLSVLSDLANLSKCKHNKLYLIFILHIILSLHVNIFYICFLKSFDF